MRRAFTLSELLAVIAIIVSLMALVFPVFAKAKVGAKATVCISNLHQIGIATQLYMVDFDDHYPIFVNAFERRFRSVRLGRKKETDPDLYPDPSALLSNYLKAPDVLHCPLDNGAEIGYSEDGSNSMFPKFFAWNGGSSYLFAELFDEQTPSSWSNSSKLIWACDGSPMWHTPDFNPTNLSAYRVNAVFYDWHVAKVQGMAPHWLE